MFIYLIAQELFSLIAEYFVATLSETSTNTYAEKYASDEKMNAKLNCKDSSKCFVQTVFGNKNAFQWDAYRSQQLPSAGRVCLSACWDNTPWVWAQKPSRCGPGDPPGVGLEPPQV